ncbi:MAG TPA: hypothetical protein VKV17_22625 [Bryobacteraceae bacterium]|nr:hypothetical protein [Bryobacteraceae bacterium]
MYHTIRKALSVSPVGPALALALLAGFLAHADITYVDFASWAAADPGYLTASIPDPGPDGFTFIGTGDSSVTYSGVQFSQTGDDSTGPFLVNIGVADSGLPAVLSSSLQPAGGTGEANILVTLPETVTGLALDYGTQDGSSVTFKVSDGSVINQPSSSGAAFGAAPDFFGVTSTTPFNSVLLTTSDATLYLNNVAFAPAGSGPPSGPGDAGSPVPEPAAWPVLAGCIGLLGTARLRRKA